MENKILDKINETKDIKKLTEDQKQQLAQEIREEIIDTVSKTGGHLASNLGVVELTIALHSVFNTPKDKIVWDVGHQTYVHKILTGRREKFSTLRQLNGLSGFPKSKESEYDTFNTGHSSTSISAALGMARARDLKKEDNHVIAVIGDGALTGGMALEALDDAGNSKTRLIVVLNDNEMSISKNVGGISRFLTKIRTRRFYKKSNNFIRKILKHIPKVGPFIIKLARRVKYSIKQLMLPNMLFEDIGFKYLGPVDGHDIERVEWILNLAKKEKEQPVLVHIITKKGKGYKPAEENPSAFHGTPSFNKETGKTIKPKEDDYSAIFGRKLVELARDNEKIVAITAAMADGTGLKKFKEEFPKRFFDVGIAEQHAITMAAGMAKEGLMPVVSIYSSFYQRAFDQVIHDICLQNLPVVMCVDRAGIVGADGETHQGIFDLSFFSMIPNLTVMAPKNFEELEQMLEFAVNLGQPVVIRYPRGKEEKIGIDNKTEIEPISLGKTENNPTTLEKAENHQVSLEKIANNSISLGKAEILTQGNDLTIIAIGKTVAKAIKVAEKLKEQGKIAEVINARFLKPLDEQTILTSISKTKNVITIEDNVFCGGLGAHVEDVILKNQISGVKFKAFSWGDSFIEQGKPEELEKLNGLDVESIIKTI